MIADVTQSVCHDRPVELVGLLWRGAVVFRIGALAYVTVLVATRYDRYDHPALGWLVLAVMAAWTAFTTWAYSAPSRRTRRLLVADLAMALGCLGASYWVLGAEELGRGRVTLPMAWVAAPMLVWAIYAGRRAGAVTALIIGVVDAVVRGWLGTGLPPEASVNATVLLLLAGVITGYVARLAEDAERQLHQAAQREAATRERERLARRIHDSVLQVLALVQRRGAELGGEAAALGRLAGEQEATLRALVATAPVGPQTSAPVGATDALVDLRTALDPRTRTTVTVAAPAEPVLLPDHVVADLVAAVDAALDNVRVHCGRQAPAWLLIESEPDAVTVTVRDDGPGIPAGRLAEADGEGRLGVAQSIIGRMRDLGGTATVTSEPSQGTEVEMRLPWRHDRPDGTGSSAGSPGPSGLRPSAGDGGRRSPDVA